MGKTVTDSSMIMTWQLPDCTEYRIRKLCGCSVRFLQILGACLKYAELKCGIFYTYIWTTQTTTGSE